MNRNDKSKTRTVRTQRLVTELAEQNSRTSEIVDELVDAECLRQETGASDCSSEFDRTAELFAVQSLILNEPSQK